MKGEWIVRNGGADLLVFFNGWGMDRHVADWVQSTGPLPPGCDLVMLYDYGDLALPPWLEGAMAGYDHVDLVAWSLGVWAAMHSGLERIRRAVAINGTPTPINIRRGIAPEIFQGTLLTWSPPTRGRFENRMFIGMDRDPRLDLVRSKRSTISQQLELRSISGNVKRLADAPPPTWRYAKVIIGSRDMIFLPWNQKAAWEGHDAVMFDGMPHFPFFHLGGWKEVLA